MAHSFQMNRIFKRLVVYSFFYLALSNTSMGQDDVQLLWSNSGHANEQSESFRHWDDEGMVPSNCAACHTDTGFEDYIGADNSARFSVDKDHGTSSGVGCNVCHNDTISTVTEIPFPSGETVKNEEPGQTACLVCHQGRASTTTVNQKTDSLPDDEVNTELSFINVHYKAAAATLFGTDVRGGYEYSGKTYAGKFNHVAPMNSCNGCHNPHSLEVSIDNCTTCHTGAEQLSDIRTNPQDFDSDKNTTEGIAGEIDTLHVLLGDSIADYATSVTKQPVAYSATRYPYFFHDSNANGEADADEAIYPNKYHAWTPRLLRAAYNYQYVAKDTGAYAHNPKYVLQLLFDSISDLSESTSKNFNDSARPK